MRSFRIIFLLMIFSLLSSFAFADELEDIEAELEKKAPPAQEAPAPLPPAASSPQGKAEAAQDAKMTDFAGLGRLAPFSEIAVLQKRYLPRTGRFELNGSLTTITNDPFFMSAGGALRFGYSFTEAWGLEGNYTTVSTSARQSTKSLEDRGVKTSSLVTPKSYVGMDIKWSPSYGKMSYLNKSIIPFDLYFALGFGTTTTNTGEAASTVHIGTGQTFAMSKSFAFRWDFSWNFYNANAKIETAPNSGIFEDKRQNFNNLFLSLGLSWFFPEASYR